MNQYKQNMSFEAEVRKLSEAYWDLEPGDCKPEVFSNEHGRSVEIDGVVRTRDVTYLIMVTTSGKKEKIESDVKKLQLAASAVSNGDPMKTVSKWLITKNQLDGAQITIYRKSNVSSITYNDFLRRFFDGAKYISLRRTYPFGSAEVSDSEGMHGKYVPLPIYISEYKSTSQPLTAEVEISLGDLCQKLIDGEVVVLMAPFGSGKSLTCREVFERLSRKYLYSDSSVVPVCVNLRDHWAQESYDILEKHGKVIAYKEYHELVVGYRANMSTLVLDGYDEIGIGGIVNVDDKNFMRDVRAKSLHGVKDLLQCANDGQGMLVVGRDHFFDNYAEMIHTLGLVGKRVHIARLGEFTDEHIRGLLEQYGVSVEPPGWMPKKPLFITYLAREELIADVFSIGDDAGFGHAWERFLELIVNRESMITKVSLEPLTIRSLLLELANDVRATYSGVGPITSYGLADVFNRVTGQEPTSQALTQLQRLPGLTVRGVDDTNRHFVDADMLSALQGFSFAENIMKNSVPQNYNKFVSGLSRFAVISAAYMLNKFGFSSDSILSVARNNANNGQFSGDCLVVALELESDTNVLDCRGLLVAEAHVGRLVLEGIRLDNVTFDNCMIDEVSLDELGVLSQLYIQASEIQKVKGVASEEGLPKPMFRDDVKVVSFDDIATNSSIVNSGALTNSKKALFSVLRKLYFQAGAGRKLSALKRGLPAGPLCEVDKVLVHLEKHGMVSIYNSVVHPVRKNSERVRKIMAELSTSNDPVVQELD